MVFVLLDVIALGAGCKQGVSAPSPRIIPHASMVIRIRHSRMTVALLFAERMHECHGPIAAAGQASFALFSWFPLPSKIRALS